MYLWCVVFVGPLRPHFFPSAKSTHQIPEENSFRGLKLFLLLVFSPLSRSLSGLPIFFYYFFPYPTPSHTASLYFPPFTTINNSPPIPPSPSPIPLTQLPVELAAVQDLADGSVIRSASPRSLSSPLLFPCLIKLQNKTLVLFIQIINIISFPKTVKF